MNTTEITLVEEAIEIADAQNTTQISSKNADSTVITHVESDQTIIIGQNSTEISVADTTNTIVAKQTEQTVRITNIGLAGGEIPVPGTTDHNELVNRDLDDQHPQSAITDLLADQAAQDTTISANTELITNHASDLNNPHKTDWENLQDKPSTFPPNEHNHDGRYYTETEIDAQQSIQDSNLSHHAADRSNPHDVIAAQVSFDNEDTQFAGEELQTVIEEIDEAIQTGTIEYAAIADPLADPNNIWDAVDQMDWTGHAHAASGQNYLEIKANHVVTFGNQTQIAYRWVGDKPIFVGPGQPVTESANYQPIGTGDHTILVNRDAADQHPQSAITGLVTGQATQDTNIGDNTDQINAHEARTNNPHNVTWQQTGGTDPAHTHSHGSIVGQTANDHHNQTHTLYGSDHSDVNITPALATRHILGHDVATNKWAVDYRAKFLAYVGGQTYYPQETVFQDGWLSAANKETTDYPAPIGIGDAKWVYQGTAPSGPSTAKQIIFGNRYTWGNNGYFKGYRVYVISGNHYTLYTVDDPLGSQIITQVSDFTADSTGWREISASKVIIGLGTVIDLVAVVNEPDPTPTTWIGDWDYTKPNNAGTPGIGDITHANKQLDQLRIHKTDNIGGNRGVELLALTNGDIVQIAAGTRWTIQDVSESADTTYVILTVAPATQDALTGIETFTFETVSATLITRMVDADWWTNNPLPNGTVQGLYIENGVYADIVPNGHAYGVDIQVQEATLSEDWDIFGSAGSSSGGGGGDFVPAVFAGAGTSGYVPDPVTESGRVLKDDGSWDVVSNETVLTGFKNILINGDFRINQRNFDGNWAGLVDGAYGYDRWKKLQPGILQQPIEAANLLDGTYTLSWDGGGTGYAQIFGTEAGTSPVVTTGILLADSWNVQLPDTATNIQLERGNVQTDFEVRNIQQELAMCQRYYWEAAKSVSYYGTATYNSTTNLHRSLYVWFPVQMRTTPTISGTKVSWDAGSITATTENIRVIGAANGAAQAANFHSMIADAEL